MVPYNHHNKTIIITYYLLLIYFINVSVSESTVVDSTLHRSRRRLLFPNSTLLQFNAGVGTPTPIKTINVNWAFQANFQLPWNRTQIPVDIFGANSGYAGLSRKKRDTDDEDNGNYENDAKLYHFYKYVEEALNGFGHNGTSCVLQTLCQLGAEPLHSIDEEDLLHELSHYILNPSNDVADQPNTDAQPYIQAFDNGQNRKDCTEFYKCTTISLIDMFSKVHDSS